MSVCLYVCMYVQRANTHTHIYIIIYIIYNIELQAAKLLLRRATPTMVRGFDSLLKVSFCDVESARGGHGCAKCTAPKWAA